MSLSTWHVRLLYLILSNVYLYNAYAYLCLTFQTICLTKKMDICMYQFLIRNGFQMKINMCTQNCSIWYYIFKTNNNIIHLKLKKAVKYLCCGCFFVVVVLLEKVGNLIQSLHNSDYTIEIRSTKYRKNIFLGFFLFRSTYQKSKVSRIIIHIKRYPRRSRIVYSCKPH